MGTSLHVIRVLALALIGIALLGATGCESKITKANFDKIQDGMTLDQVQQILGEGKQRGDGSGVAAQFGVDVGGARGGSNTEMFTWESDKHTITVHFVGGVVKAKNFK